MLKKVKEYGPIILAVAFSVIGGRIVSDWLIKPTKEKQDLGSIVLSIANLEKQISQELPKKLDEYTALISIRADGNRAILGHKIDVSIREITMTGIEEEVTKHVCASAAAPLINRGAVFLYSYIDKFDQKIGEFTLRSCPPKAS